jgi:hypothetical protein
VSGMSQRYNIQVAKVWVLVVLHGSSKVASSEQCMVPKKRIV